jgi:antitoxin component YwqK of YwqJK toxin-antitoxin module
MNGQKSNEITYKDGNYDGKNTYWYENGQKEGEVTWKDDELISEKCWDEDGNEKECD